MNFKQFSEKAITEFEEYIKSIRVKENKLDESINYSLLNGGKRIRPLMMFILMDAFGKDYKQVFEVALSLEMIHTYSLIHDDLPILDNDSYRRGKPTNHLVYGEDLALLSGDALLTDSFNILAGAPFEDDILILLVTLLSKAAGSKGMVLGQYHDIKTTATNLESLKKMHSLKTGALIEYCFRSVCVINKVDIDTQIKLIDIAKNIGLAFQVKDDLLDTQSTLEELGKDVNSDLEQGKITYVSLLGMEEAQKTLDQLIEDSLDLLDTLNIKKDYLSELIKYIKLRRK